MGRVFVVELEGRCYRCKHCDCPLALSDDIISRKFNCRKGRAYLFKKVVNVSVGPLEERMMLTGMHTVEDVLCCCCGQLLGWKYVAAQDKDQRYKEGKFVLERYASGKQMEASRGGLGGVPSGWSSDFKRRRERLGPLMHLLRNIPNVYG